MANDVDSNDLPPRIVAVTEAERERAYTDIVSAPQGTVFDRRTAEISGIHILDSHQIYPDTRSIYNRDVLSAYIGNTPGLLSTAHSSSRERVLDNLDPNLERVLGMINNCLAYQEQGSKGYVPDSSLGKATTDFLEAMMDDMLNILRMSINRGNELTTMPNLLSLSGYALPSEGYWLMKTQDGQSHLLQSPGRIGFMLGYKAGQGEGYNSAVVAIITNGFSYTDSNGEDIYIKPRIDISSLSPNGIALEDSALKASELGMIVEGGSLFAFTNSPKQRERFYPDTSVNGKLLYLTSTLQVPIQGDNRPLDGQDYMNRAFSGL